MKTIFQILFLLFFTMANCQTFNYNSIEFNYDITLKKVASKESLENFGLKGKVKEIKTNDYSIYVNNDSKKTTSLIINDTLRNFQIEDESIQRFNLFGKLTFEGYIDRNGKLTPQETYTYDSSGYKIRKELYYKDSISSIEKFIYDKKNNLIEHWIKSKLQKDFFIKEKFNYDEKNHITKEYDLNNHIPIFPNSMCTVGFPDCDYITVYQYNNKNQLKNKQTYEYEYSDSLKESPDESYFKKMNETIFFYKGNSLIKEILKGRKWSLSFNDTITTSYKYKEHLLIEKRPVSSNLRSSNFVEKYTYTDNNLSLFEIAILHENIDRPYKKYYFENNRIRKQEGFSDANKIMDYWLFDNHETVSESRRENGNHFKFKIDYDSNGNWIKYYKYSNEKLIGYVEREISYF